MLIKKIASNTKVLSLMTFFTLGASFATPTLACSIATGGCPISCEKIGSLGDKVISVRSVKSRAMLGSTSAEVDEKFAGIQELNFSNGNAKLLVSRLTDKEFSDLAVTYNRAGGGNNSRLLHILATRLDAPSLVRVAKAFGNVATQQAVNSYAPATTGKAFATLISGAVAIPAYAKTATSFSPVAEADGAAPTSDMTLQEIYLDFRTAPVGSLGPASALSETLIYSGAYLYGAWTTGYAVGTGIHNVIEAYDPAYDDVIGGTIQNMFDDIGGAASELKQGQWEKAADQLFGTAVGETGDYTGDYDMGASYEDYESTGSC